MISLSKENLKQKLLSADVFLYGAGMTGKRVMDIMRPFQINVKYIVDDNEDKWGTKLDDVEIISYAQFIEMSEQFSNIAMVLTSIYGKVLLKKLESVENIFVYEMYGWVESVYRKEHWSNHINENDLARFKREIDLLNDSLDDYESIQVLNGIYNYLCSKDLKYIYDICSEYDQYFIPEVLKVVERPLSIADVGAYEGELYQTIKKYNIDLEHWYCFEADHDNYERLLQQSKKDNLRDIEICIGGGVWNCSGTLYFEHGKGTESKIVDYKTDSSIKVISLDSYFANKKCDFIKMDIEGAEYHALCGGINIIKRDRPILTISIYHSMEDYYRIPKYLRSELQDYKFYIRQHSLILSETVLYAIPNELKK